MGLLLSFFFPLIIKNNLFGYFKTRELELEFKILDPILEINATRREQCLYDCVACTGPKTDQD